MRIRTVLLATTLLTTAGLARAEPVRLDGPALEAVRAGALRGVVGTTATQGTAFAAGPSAVALTEAANSSQTDGRTLKLVATTKSRAAVGLRSR